VADTIVISVLLYAAGGLVTVAVVDDMEAYQWLTVPLLWPLVLLGWLRG
jgi:hypothetical protein